MGRDESNKQSGGFSFTASHAKWIASSLIVPIVVAILTAYATSRFTIERSLEHSLAIAVIRSDNAVEPEYQDDILLFPFLSEPEATPIPASQFTYTVVIRNDGSFTEHDLEVALRFAPSGNEDGRLVMNPTVDSSLMLLRPDIVMTSENDFNYHVEAVDFVRDDWISFETTWDAPMRVLVEARSQDAYDSQYL